MTRKLIAGALACTFIIGIASADPFGTPLSQRPGTSAPMALGVQGVAGGVAVPISGSVTVSSAAVTQSTSPWVTADNHTTAAAPLACRQSDGAAFYDNAKTGQLPTALDGSGFLKTHEQGTATVAGTVAATQSGAWTNACTQSGTYTVQPGNTANSTAWLVTGTGGTFPVTGTVTTTPPSNASTNIAQWNGSTALSGGVAGAVGVNGLANNGATISGYPVPVAALGFNNAVIALRLCDKRIAFSTLGTTATVQQIALAANQTIWVCGWYALISTATTAVQVKWVTGTGSNCVTGTADVTPFVFTTPTAAPAIANWIQNPSGGQPVSFSVTSNALCITQSSATNSTTLSGVIYYTQGAP